MTEQDALFERLLETYEQNPEEIEAEEPLMARAFAKIKANGGLGDILQDTQDKLRLEREYHQQAREKIAGLTEELNAVKAKLEDEDSVRTRLMAMQEQFIQVLSEATERAREPIFSQDDYERTHAPD